MPAEAIIIRHGESLCCAQERFCGWSDSALSDVGIAQSLYAARLLARAGYSIDMVFTSVLHCAIRSAWIVLEELNRLWVPMEKNWRLNERHVGVLQGMKHATVLREFGADQYQRWCRHFSARPPVLTNDDPRHPRFDPRYLALGPSQLPTAESLQDCLQRILPYWTQTIVPHLRRGERVLLVSHGECLRALSKHVEEISDNAIENLFYPHALPVLYRFNERIELIEREILGQELSAQRQEAQFSYHLSMPC